MSFVVLRQSSMGKIHIQTLKELSGLALRCKKLAKSGHTATRQIFEKLAFICVGVLLKKQEVNIKPERERKGGGKGFRN